MENASKALIIAGAIVFNQAQDSLSGSGMSKAQVTTFNSTFTKYEGTKSGSDVKSLIQEVNASNTQDTSDNTGRSITLKLGTADLKKNTGSTGYATGEIKSAGKYKVEITKYDNAGYVSEITFTKQ